MTHRALDANGSSASRRCTPTSSPAARCSGVSPTTPTTSAGRVPPARGRRGAPRRALVGASCAKPAWSRRRPRVPFRVKALCFLARHFGTEAVLPLMLRTEAAEADRYRDDAEATDTMAQQEAAAGRTIAAMQGIPAGGRIARSEGRHRAGIGGTLRAVVFGMNDGLVSNFSLVMGVAGGTARQQHRDPRRRRGTGGGRVLDGVGRVDLDPLAARAVRERAPHRAGGAARVPGGGARGAGADLPGEGHRARGGAVARRQHHAPLRRRARHARPRRARSRSRDSSARRGSPRSRRSSRSRSARRSR